MYFLILMNNKNYDLFYKFKEIKVLVENEEENRIKVLRIDNGGQFYKNKFNLLCKKCRILKTTPYTPKQNGDENIMNKTLMDKENIMIRGDYHK